MIEKIISGGQTGADQAALKIATESGIPVGGWCPKGGLDENGKNILDQYPSLQETSASIPNQRTKLNIEYSDGTLILVPRLPLPENIKDGTILTIEHAKKINKPFLIIDLSKADFSYTISEWMHKNKIKILNVAGPRESNSPGIHDATYELLRNTFF